jgi:TerC family integral membrane protein
VTARAEVDLALAPEGALIALAAALGVDVVAIPALAGPAPVLGLVAVIGALLLVDLKLFARGREPTLREAAAWSVGWLLLSLAAALPVLALDGTDGAINYLSVYLVERSLSLDNLFVFFGIRREDRPRLLLWGIVAALLLRGAAIVAGVALIERFQVILYLLGAGLLVLAYRMWRGIEQDVDVERNVMVRLVRRLLPVAGDAPGGRFLVRRHGARHATPLLLCLGAVVVADVAFAIDSIPAAFAITRDSLVIWMANAFALLGLRSLFVLVEGLARRLRYLDQTIAAVLALVAVKLLLADVIHVGPLTSLALIAGTFAIGISVSLVAGRTPRSASRARSQLDG